MNKNLFVNYGGDVLVVELELLHDNLDVERAIREAALERCKILGTSFSQEGIDYISFLRDVNEEHCEKHGFKVKHIHKMSTSVVDATQKIVSPDEAQFHVAFSYGTNSYHWDYIMTALSLAKMCSKSKQLREIKELQLLEWAAEFVNDKKENLEEFFKQKTTELKTVTQGGV